MPKPAKNARHIENRRNQRNRRMSVPVLCCRNGNAFALTSAPMLPHMFMAPETLPVRAPAMSVQKTQLGLMVMSAPNIAS